MALAFEEIKEFFHGDVAADDITLKKFSRDYSIFKVRPQIVVFPERCRRHKKSGEIRRSEKGCVRERWNRRIYVFTGRSAGTDSDLAGTLSQSIIVSCSRNILIMF